MMIVLAVMVVLIVLSEVGVDIAPLLAGAGIVGLAIGFGSQALVKDIITGLFILIEDTLAVGDVVDVGNDHAGVVEAILVRTIRAPRHGAGTVHTVPFSDVTSVKNLTRDLLLLRHRRAGRLSRGHRRGHRGAAAGGGGAQGRIRPLARSCWRRSRSSASIASSRRRVIISIRLKTLPTQQWTVGREFNRRMKKAFDAKGIEMPSSHHTLYFGADPGDNTPPIRVAVETPAAEGKSGS